MSQHNLRIVFFGTPDFAVASLAALVDAGKNIVAVITSPDKPGGRGLQIQQSAVKKYAIAKGIPILQPEKLKAESFIEELTALHADVQVVVAFRMLPEIVWNMPPLGTINVHASLLPYYRGAAPINWAIINGEKETGVTTFKLQHTIDTGPILLQASVPIENNETAGTLHDKLMEEGAALLCKTIEGLESKALVEYPQDVVHEVKHAPKLFTETCKINWHHTVDEVFNFIRGLSPYPTAFTEIANKKIKIFTVEKVMSNEKPLTPSKLSSDNKSYLHIACADGYISVLELQPEGKKRMVIADYLRGNKISY